MGPKLPRMLPASRASSKSGTSAKHNLCSFIYIITPQSTFATDSGAVGRVGFLYILNILGERFLFFVGVASFLLFLSFYFCSVE